MNFNDISLSDWVQIIIAFITFFGIIVSIVITIITMRKNSKTIEEANRAQIIFYIDYNPSCDMYFLIIKNFGNSVGKVIDIDISPKLDWKKTEFNQEIKALTDAKNILLAPNQKVSSWFDFNNYPDKVFNVIIKYSTLNKIYCESYTIDLNYIDNIDWLFPSVIDDHSTNEKAVLYKINNTLRDLTDKFR